MSLEKSNLAAKLAKITHHWQPKIVGSVNDYHVKIAKIEGEFIWHKHDNTDELFIVLDGVFTMKLRDGDIELSEGEMIVIPKGVEHCPVADEECSIMMIELAGTLNTGDQIDSELTLENPESI